MSTTTKKPSEVLREALALLGPNGERWIKHAYFDAYADDSLESGGPALGRSGCSTCATGAICMVEGRPPMLVEDFPGGAWSYLSAACDGAPIIHFNDEAAGFPEVRAAFERAIALAEKAEAQA